MSIQIKYAYRRHNTWTYRRTYPQHLRGILGSSLKQSLKTSDAKLARKRVAQLNSKFTEIVQEAEGHAAQNDTYRESRQIGVAVDLSRFSAAPRARLSHLSFESDRAFPAQC